MKLDRSVMRLYAVTNRDSSDKEFLASQVLQALEGGVTCIQLREKGLNYDDFLTEAILIKELCRSHNVPFIINDNIDIALACGADGVHLGQKDMNAKEARKLVGEKMILGVSAQTPQQALQAEADGADYLGVGAVFGTSTKLDAKAVSFDTLKEITQSVSIPVVAIGGINKSNILRLKGSGADGVAVVSAIFSSNDVKNVCKELYKLSWEMAGYED